MDEGEFVSVALEAAKGVLVAPLSVERRAPLLYQVTVNNRLEISASPKDPKRGKAAFETDLCVFDQVSESIRLPRVVLEFKSRLTTHDVLTYSAKARKHKQVYPYLRYGMVIAELDRLPGRFFTHNEALDFGVAAKSYGRGRLQRLFRNLLEAEVAASRRLESIIFGDETVHVFRAGVEALTDEGGGT